MSKSENKLTEDLSLSPVCHLNDDLRIIMEEYHSVSEQSLNECDDLVKNFQKCLVTIFAGCYVNIRNPFADTYFTKSSCRTNEKVSPLVINSLKCFQLSAVPGFFLFK